MARRVICEYHDNCIDTTSCAHTTPHERNDDCHELCALNNATCKPYGTRGSIHNESLYEPE